MLLTNSTLIRRLLALSWRYRWGCVKVLALQIAILALGLFGIAFAGLGIDEMRHAVDPGTRVPLWPLALRPAHWTAMQRIEGIAGLVLLCGVLRGVIDYFYRVALNHLVQAEIVVHLRSEVYDKLQRLSFRFFDANASSSIINRVTSDVQSVRMFVDQVLMQSVIMVLSLASYLAYMMMIHVPLTIACLATAPALWLVSQRFARLVQPAFRENRELVDRMIQRLSENIRGIHVVKAFARERDEIEKFRAANETVRTQKRWMFRQISIFTPLIGFLSQLNLVALLGYGGYLVVKGELPLGTGLLAFAGLLQQFAGQIANIATIANSMQESLTGARRVFEVLDAPIEIQNKPEPIWLPRTWGRITFDHVWFAYGEDAVLQDIDFDVQPGQSVAVVGPTGSGKSALLSLIPRFYDPIRGSVQIDGIDIRKLELDAARRNVGLVFQESFLFSTSIAANIAFGVPDATRAQIEKAARIAAAHDFITALPHGYETILGERGLGLSGGQRQRLAIARALLLDPAILVLDDPTASVDPGTEHEIIQAMNSAMANRTTFLVANRLSVLRRADLIIVLDRGRIVQRGTHEELMRAPGYYAEIAALQSEPATEIVHA